MFGLFREAAKTERAEGARTRAAKGDLKKDQSNLRAVLKSKAAAAVKAPAKKNLPKSPSPPGKKTAPKKTASAAASKKRKAEDEPTTAPVRARFFYFSSLVPPISLPRDV